MKLRKASPKDAVGIASVLKECYNVDSIEEGINIFRQETSKGYNYIVADDNGRIAGLTTWQMHGLPKHQLCELDRIAVLKEFRGKNLGKALFNELIKEADSEYKKQGFKLRKLYILTHADNKAAQAFYKKMGCNNETTLKSHYYRGKDEFVFSRFF
ncbi:GNAT family N-acetyltransferase [Candidatus Woesearchaeota archaeon]|nr:GNAT family N-acetyltransferase [Candidatus Woesearchaeota archaeon]